MTRTCLAGTVDLAGMQVDLAGTAALLAGMEVVQVAGMEVVQVVTWVEICLVVT